MNNSFFRDKRFYFIILGLFLVINVYAANPPRDFPSGTMISMREGSGLQELALKLEEDKVINSPFWFRAAAIFLGGERIMKAGQYYLPYPQSTFVIAWRIVSGDHGIESIKITIPEGYTVEKISNLFDERFQYFDQREFLVKAKEGYLFPDTYFMPVNAKADDVIKILKGNFSRQVAGLKSEIEDSGRTLDEIVNMASIIEKEASGDSDRALISGILWKRLVNSIALQVDVALVTYERRGLPDEPISNPGILSLKAAIHPANSPYLYYLHDKTGAIHYARTFDEHKINKQKYLKN